MTTNTASAKWNGDLPSGKGTLSLNSGTFQGAYSFKSRFEGESGTNPEELIAAAHAACFSMAFSHGLAQAGFQPNSVETFADVTLDKVENGFAITKITLRCTSDVPGISQGQFDELAEAAKTGCPVSKALASVPSIELHARLHQAAA